MDGGRCKFKTFLKVLREQQADEHHAPLSAMHNPETILDPDAGILCTARLTSKNGVDTTNTRPIYDFARHTDILL